MITTIKHKGRELHILKCNRNNLEELFLPNENLTPKQLYELYGKLSDLSIKLVKHSVKIAKVKHKGCRNNTPHRDGNLECYYKKYRAVIRHIREIQNRINFLQKGGLKQ